MEHKHGFTSFKFMWTDETEVAKIMDAFAFLISEKNLINSHV